MTTPTGHVDDRKGRIDCPSAFCDFPAIHIAGQIDVGDKGTVTVVCALKEGNGFFAGSRDLRFKAALNQSVFNDSLN